MGMRSHLSPTGLMLETSIHEAVTYRENRKDVRKIKRVSVLGRWLPGPPPAALGNAPGVQSSVLALQGA